MRWREHIDRGLIRADSKARERVLGPLESAARFLRAAEKNVTIEEYEMAHLAAYNSAFHSVRAFLYAAGYVERSHAWLLRCGIPPVTTPRLQISSTPLTNCESRDTTSSTAARLSAKKKQCSASGWPPGHYISPGSGSGRASCPLPPTQKLPPHFGYTLTQRPHRSPPSANIYPAHRSRR